MGMLDTGTVDTQGVGDEIFDIRLALYDGVVLCTTNFIGYILCWRSFLLSICVCAGLITTWFHPWTTGIIIPIMMAILLVLLWSEEFRTETCAGGMNAPLNQEGFEQVARWRNTNVMARFVRRM